VLTDRGRCFTPAFAQACAALGAKYRHTKPYTPQTNGLVERFNGRVSSKVPGITIYSHRDLEQFLRGFNAGYHARRQRVLDGQTPNQVVAERLQARRHLAHAKTHGRAEPDEIAKARLIVEAAKEVSQPDTPILQLQLVQLLQQTMPEQRLHPWEDSIDCLSCQGAAFAYGAYWPMYSARE
jgi:Integrase core domain